MNALQFVPVYQDYVWGGSRIAKKFERSGLPERCAESWEIADRPEGMSHVLEGPFKGRSLHDLLGPSLLGIGRYDTCFPLLIKIIDAKEHLSIQVHPSETTASLCRGEPKTEMWYVLEGGTIFVGFKKPADPEAFTQAVCQGTVAPLLKEIEVRPGDVVFIPGGRLHAIGAGCMMLEVQQNSNTTYRVYDWSRLGHDGKMRALHTEQAFKCIQWDDTGDPIVKPKFLENKRWELLSTPFFSLEKLEVSGTKRIESDPKTFQIFFHLESGKTWLLPSVAKPLDLQAGGNYLKISL